MHWGNFIKMLGMSLLVMCAGITPKSHASIDDQYLQMKMEFCDDLLEDFQFAYLLYNLGVKEATTWEIVVLTPRYTPQAKYILDAGVRALYSVAPNVPDQRTYLYAAQMTCINVDAQDYTPPMDWRPVYNKERKDI